MLKRFFLGSVCAVLLACPNAATTKPPGAPSGPSQATWRAGVVVVARAIGEADRGCAMVVRAKAEGGDVAGAKLLAAKCDTAYDRARDSLVVADDLIDGLQQKDAPKVACSLLVAVELLQEMLADIAPISSDAIEDAVVFAAPLAHLCPNYKDAGSSG